MIARHLNKITLFYLLNNLFQLSFPTSYLVVCGVVFSYVLLDDVIVISFIAGLYFKMDKFVKVSDSLV